jgi:hypothetical protein
MTLMLGVRRVNGHRRATPHGGDNRAAPTRLKSDHHLVVEGSRLAGTLGEEIETQNHGSTRRHSVNQPLRQSREHLIRLVSQHRVGIGK